MSSRSRGVPEPTALPFDAGGFFVMRTPLLPFDEYESWTTGLRARECVSDSTALADALRSDRALLRERLRCVVTRPEVMEALFLASPSVAQAAEQWVSGDDEAASGIERPIARYFTRMTSRATPFGLFASTSMGVVSAATTLRVPARSDLRRRTRLDFLALLAIADHTVAVPSVFARTMLTPNSSLHESGDRYRFIRHRLQGWLRVYQVAAVERTRYLDETLARARGGATLDALAAPLVDDDISEADALAYVRGLVERQILVMDAAVPVTGPEPAEALAAWLGRHAGATDARAEFERVDVALTSLDHAGLGNAPAAYEKIRALTKGIGVDVGVSALFQVDLTGPSSNLTLGSDVLDEISRWLSIAERLPSRAHRHQTALDAFRDAFADRYGDREVPLGEVLDEDIGLGYANGPETSSLLDQFSLAESRSGRVDDVEPVVALVLRKLSEALHAGAREITLETADIEQLSSDSASPLPDALAVVAILASSSDEAIARGDFQVLVRAAVGPSGAGLFGRFCHADSGLRENVKRFFAEEAARRPDAIFAEVVHLPQGRAGNVMSRPVLREYEIPYLASSGAPLDRQIPASDLRVSVHGDRVVLRSERLDREVIPRLSTAHDYTVGSLAVYRFLGALQHQGTAPRPGWSWGALSSAPFLPRVRLGRLVLARARWLLTPSELAPILGARDAERFQLVRALVASRLLPERVLFTGGDNHLLVDFGNVISIDAFLDEARRATAVTLDELFPGGEALCATGVEGRFAHELMIPFIRRAPVGRVDTATSVMRPRSALPPARFLPGSEWLYVKLYGGAAAADRVLIRVVGPLARRAVESGAVRRWFFVRFRDPQPHLRIRFEGDAARLLGEVLPALHDAVGPLLESGEVSKVQLDTYDREEDRYGGRAGIASAEDVFFRDSEAVVDILTALSATTRGPDTRWHLAIVGMDLLLDDFGFDVKEKLDVVSRLRRSFAVEFGAGKPFRQQASLTFRKERAGLEALLAGRTDAEPLLSIAAPFRTRSEASALAIAGLVRATSGVGARALTELAQSFLHMHVNRILPSAHRRHEVVLYDYLTRLYESRLARP